MAKKNMTVRIDDEMREKLQLVADREMRPLANQILFFLSQGMESYLERNKLHYHPEEGQLLTDQEHAVLLQRQKDHDIPF